jgi:two-component system, OmpR family, sensor histidine kinase SenX3
LIAVLLLLVGVAFGAVATLLLVARPNRRDAGATLAQLAEETERTALVARARDRLADALDALEDGVVVVDDQGDIVVRNRAAMRFHEARHSGRVVEDAIDALLAAAARGEAGQREVALFGPPKQVLFLRAEPLRAHGRIAGAVVWVHDISEARRVDDMRRDFVANVSHELRTPIGALGLLAETIADESDPANMRHFAERLVREADRLARIVDDLLDLSLIEIAEAPAREAVALHSLVRDAVDKVRVAAEAAGIELLVGDVPGSWAVACDRRQVVSAIYNLLDNAVKYSERDSTIDVSAQVNGDRVEVSVRDHGIGIPTRDLERIFERFYRVDRARSRETGGTGLGLSIVRHVAQSHGGEVAVVSREGEGSRFTLSLPLTLIGTTTDVPAHDLMEEGLAWPTRR